MSKNPLIIRHTFLGFKEIPEKESHSFVTGKGVKTPPAILLERDYCTDDNEVEIERKNNTQFLKTFYQNVHK